MSSGVLCRSIAHLIQSGLRLPLSLSLSLHVGRVVFATGALLLISRIERQTDEWRSMSFPHATLMPSLWDSVCCMPPRRQCGHALVASVRFHSLSLFSVFFVRAVSPALCLLCLGRKIERESLTHSRGGVFRLRKLRLGLTERTEERDGRAVLCCS